MKYDLDPNNRDQPDAVLLDDLRAASSKLRVQKLTREAYSEAGRFSAATIAARFGGWGKALVKAGVAPSRHFSVLAEECMVDLRRVAEETGAETVTVAEYKKHGRYSEKPFARHFGTWVEALKAAGLGVSDQYHPRTTNEELFENLEAVWQGLGRQPSVNDMFPPLSRFSAHVYKRRFGGFRQALEAFVVAAKKMSADEVPREDGPVVHALPQASGAQATTRTGARSVGWRLRYLVLKRDQFKCRACGRSPASDPGTVLQIDHVEPWSRGGSTVESNLQTLCEKCNIGKGAA